MSFKTAKVTLASAVAQNGTITVNYPAGTTSGHFAGGSKHQAFAEGLQANLAAPADFTVSFGSSNITVTYKGATSIPANTAVLFQFDMVGRDDPFKFAQPLPVLNLGTLVVREVNLGAPAAGSAAAIAASQSLAAATTAGATLTAGAAALDVPRNVVAAWTGTAVLTVTGKDQYGKTVVESSASGTSFTGKKAFASVTKVTVSADVTALTVGTGNVLGLPVALPQAGQVIGELQDGAKPTAGTITAAVTSAATATTGDVRGTYAPNATPDGSKAFQLIVAIPDPTDLGVAQFAG
ncbi:hypothetical protein [Bradyrhizobium neotropicale]|uniref:hypothetical protein n=1 Tax=Bradyrhizobium neotropicale TaxID=1497615 RepID=UPI001AD77669|nr:hypothetical protein [Bradyrhizobium neotropicale]MBO4228016.1 hypothetical protein [Bradyrhizobium neotropicale]